MNMYTYAAAAGVGDEERCHKERFTYIRGDNYAFAKALRTIETD